MCIIFLVVKDLGIQKSFKFIEFQFYRKIMNSLIFNQGYKELFFIFCMAKYDGLLGQPVLEVEEPDKEGGITFIFKDNRFLFIKAVDGKIESVSIPEQGRNMGKFDQIKMIELVKVEDPDSEGGITMIFQENKKLQIKLVDGKLVSEFN